MTRGRSEQVFAAKVTADGRRRFPDKVVVEEPLEIRVDGVTMATTMRTPGDDFALAVGWAWAEGLLVGTTVDDVRYCATGSAVDTHFNVVSVGTARGVLPDGASARLTTTTAACGICGTDAVDALTARLDRLPDPPPLTLDAVQAAAVAARAAQPLFSETGGSHAAAAFDLATGELDVVGEDIGRHNAVDRVVGRLALDGRLPATGRGLFVSGRASFEMVQKAWAAGFSWLAAVGGASSLAVTTARAANLGLVAFVREGTMTRYSPEDRP